MPGTGLPSRAEEPAGRLTMHWITLLLYLLPLPLPPQGTLLHQDVGTFSIVAYDPDEEAWGVAVASRYFSVGSVVPWAEAGVGAVATQANVNVGYGPQALQLLRQGMPARTVLDRLLAEDPFEGKDGRQVAVIDAAGRIAVYTGPKAQSWAGDRQGRNWTAQGNILAGPQVVEAMGAAFEATPGELAEKLYAALAAGEKAGGDSRGRQSASLLVVRKQGGRNINNDRYVYLNVDDHPDPLWELRRLLDMNLGYTYRDKALKAAGLGQIAAARDAGERAARYLPKQTDIWIVSGLLEYVLGKRDTALERFHKARDLDPGFRSLFERLAGSRVLFQPILHDDDFLKRLFPPD